MIHHK
ncbi:hypothetical protein Bhyg_08944 [Pseudolycoriella hygida]